MPVDQPGIEPGTHLCEGCAFPITPSAQLRPRGFEPLISAMSRQHSSAELRTRSEKSQLDGRDQPGRTRRSRGSKIGSGGNRTLVRKNSRIRSYEHFPYPWAGGTATFVVLVSAESG